MGKASNRWASNYKNSDGAKLAVIYIKGMVQNPAALLVSADFNDARGRLDLAIDDLKLAISLLEMHNAPAKTIEPYRIRLEGIELRDAEIRILAKRHASAEEAIVGKLDLK